MAIANSVFNAVVAAVHNAFGFPFGEFIPSVPEDGNLYLDFVQREYFIVEEGG